MRNPFRRGKDKHKKKKQDKISEVTKQNIKDFLALIDDSVEKMFSNQTSKDLEKQFKIEAETWFNNTIAVNKSLDPTSFKAGMCYALWKSMEKINANEEPEDPVTYIA